MTDTFEAEHAALLAAENLCHYTQHRANYLAAVEADQVGMREAR